MGSFEEKTRMADHISGFCLNSFIEQIVEIPFCPPEYEPVKGGDSQFAECLTGKNA
jgi:hypothetical protein